MMIIKRFFKPHFNKPQRIKIFKASLLLIPCFILPFAGLLLFFSLLSYAKDLSFLDILAKPYIRQIIFFSLLQAFLSSFLSVFGGIMLALMTIRLRSIFLRLLLVQIYGLLFVIPSIIAIGAIISAYGAEGYVTIFLRYFLPIERLELYGINGIIFSHVFFNLPLAARFFYLQLYQIPHLYFYTAQNLGFSAWHIFRHLDWPAMSRVILPLSLIIFIYCFTSFAVVLVFGGSPKYTNLELSIYQHLRYDFDLASAASLSIIQSFILFLVILIFAPLKHHFALPAGRSECELYRPERNFITVRIHDMIAFLLCFVIAILPLSSLVAKSFSKNIILIILQSSFLHSILTSLQIAFATLITSFLLTYLILECWRFIHIKLGYTRLAHRSIFISYLGWLFTPAILGTGLFLLLYSYQATISLPVWLSIVIVNSFFSTLLLLFFLYETYRRHVIDYSYLCQNLGLCGLRRSFLIDYQLLRRPLGAACAIVFIISLGDLTTVTLFSQGDTITLPLYIHRLLFSYRFDDAASASIIFLVLNILILMIFSYRDEVVRDA